MKVVLHIIISKNHKLLANKKIFFLSLWIYEEDKEEKPLFLSFLPSFLFFSKPSNKHNKYFGIFFIAGPVLGTGKHHEKSR